MPNHLTFKTVALPVKNGERGCRYQSRHRPLPQSTPSSIIKAADIKLE